MKTEQNIFLNWHNKVHAYFLFHLNIKNPKLQLEKQLFPADL